MQQLLASTIVVCVASGVALVVAQSQTNRPDTTAPVPAARTQPARVSAPPLPVPGFAPARPVDQARAVYEFAAQHPEVLKFVPCYCGCESSGHGHNESCFVKSRDAKGNVTEWDTHGFGCAICIDVAREAMMMYRSGADAVAIRASIEKKWTPKFSTKTPTPNPPPRKSR